MKKVLVLLVAVMMTAGMMAQEVVQRPVRMPESAQLTCIGNSYYCGRQALSQSQMLDWYAQQNCQAAYDQFAKGKKMALAGWICLGIGGALDLGSAVCTGIYLFNEYSSSSGGNTSSGGSKAPMRDQATSSPSYDPLFTTALFLGLGAAAFEITCVPLLVVGYHKMHNSAEIYNVLCTTAQAQPYWTLQASENGLGLALKF